MILNTDLTYSRSGIAVPGSANYGTNSGKSKGVVWENFPRGTAPRESLITRGTSHGQTLQTIPEDFSLFVRLWASKTEEDAAQSCPMVLSGETVGSDLLKSDSVRSRLWWLKNKVW